MLCGLSEGACEGWCDDRPGLCGLTRLAWPKDSNLAAVLLWDDAERRGSVWMNRRHTHGPVGLLVYGWAMNRAWRGIAADVLTRADLDALTGDRTATLG